MSSVPEIGRQALHPPKAEELQWQTFAHAIDLWNGKLHYYVGLYLLLFIWLFAFSGLMLNHHWTFDDFWSKRKVSTTEQAIHPPPHGSDLENAKGLMRQLHIAGEVEFGEAPPAAGRLDFQVTTPRLLYALHADLVKGVVTIQRTEVNVWGNIHILHTYSGVRRDNPHMQRTWTGIRIWSFCMDAIALGLIFVVLSSYIMWWGLEQHRFWGLVALFGGFLACGFFVVGLARLYP
jgi:hypothetical protein